MKFLADENFPFSSVALLVAAGHDVSHVAKVAAGSSDEQVVALANSQERGILTFDGDIGTLAFERNQTTIGGIVYFRLINYTPERPGQMLLDHLAANPEVELRGRITVFDPPRVRQRKF